MKTKTKKKKNHYWIKLETEDSKQTFLVNKYQFDMIEKILWGVN